MAKSATQFLHTFIWQGKTKTRQWVRGEDEAKSVAALRVKLQAQGITAVRIRQVSRWYSLNHTIRTADIALITEHLAMITTAGMPILQGLHMLIEHHHNPAMRQLLRNIKVDIESGCSLSQSVKKYPRYFDPLFGNLIHVGEQTGCLETVLYRLHDHQQKMQRLKQKIKKALFYPMTVMLIACSVMVIMLVVVVPKFQAMFAQFDAELPSLTQVVLAIADDLKNHGWAWCISLVCGGILARQLARRSLKVRALLDQGMLRLPLMGKLFQQAMMARFARTLGITCAAGVPLLTALHLVAMVLPHTQYRQHIVNTGELVRNGHALHHALTQKKLFPPLAIQMIQVGEATGMLDTMLYKMADIYDAQVDHTVEQFSSLLEPVLMSIVGILVGGLMMALYLPIFQLGSIM